MYRKKLFHCALLCITLFCLSASERKLTDVLIIGDSISLGYTPFVAELLKEKALVVHSPGNSRDTNTGLKHIDKWLAPKKWDIIYFNFGMWDYCYRHPESEESGNRDKVRGTLTSTPEQYANNLRTLIRKMKATGAKVIFATSTIVPPLEAGRFEKDPPLYNKVAVKVMKQEGVVVDDLYKLSLKIHPSHGLGNNDVHYSKEGYKLFGEQVAKTISKHIKK